MGDRASGGLALEQAALRALESVRLEAKSSQPGASSTPRSLQKSASSIERRKDLFQKFDDIIKCANMDAPQHVMEHKLFKSRSLNYRGDADFFASRTSAPGTDPSAASARNIRNRSLSMGHYGRLPSFSTDGAGHIGYLASSRVLSSSLASESVREEAGEGEDVDTPTSATAAMSPGSLMIQEGLHPLMDTAATSRLRTATTPALPPPGMLPDGSEDPALALPEEEEGGGDSEGPGSDLQQQARQSATGSEGTGGRRLSGTPSDPLGMGYAPEEDDPDGVFGGGGERDRPSRQSSRSSRPNPWAPLPGPLAAAVAPIHVQRMQEAQRSLTTLDSMRIRAPAEGSEQPAAPFKLGLPDCA